MKKLVLVLGLILTCSTIIAQTRVNYSSTTNAYGSIGTVDANLNNSDGVEGSPLLLNDWNNSATIYLDNDKQLDIQNINFNIQNSTFASKMSKDSIFTFYNVNKVVMNNRTFIQINNKFYENLATINDGYLLKSYSLKVVPEKHKITNTVIGPGKYEIENDYFLINNGKLSGIKLRKKDILQHVNTKKDKVSKYVKDHKLSYSKERDIVKIFEHFEN